jgi:UDP-N-acetylmuramoyl-tripeptide--D-alanyl-D-alanine ligase
MRAAIEALVGLATSRDGASWAVVGEMRELGEESAGLHRATGRAAASLGVDHLVVVGEVAAEVGEGARGVAGWSGTCTAVATADDAVAALGAARASDVVLVKASNAIGLWRVAEQLVGGVGAHR